MTACIVVRQNNAARSDASDHSQQQSCRRSESAHITTIHRVLHTSQSCDHCNSNQSGRDGRLGFDPIIIFCIFLRRVF